MCHTDLGKTAKPFVTTQGTFSGVLKWGANIFDFTNNLSTPDKLLLGVFRMSSPVSYWGHTMSSEEVVLEQDPPMQGHCA